MQKIAFYTLGCKLNFSESSTLLSRLEKQGYQSVEFTNAPDVFVINTCSVTDNADKKCKKIVREAKKISPQSKVIIIGCYAQLKPDEIMSIPGVHAVLGAAEKFLLPEKLPSILASAPVAYHHTSEELAFHPSVSEAHRTRVFLKIQDGCDYVCSFCTIPQARGKSRSGSIAQLVEEVKKQHEQGVKEIIITGVNIGDFGLQNGERKEDFFQLIQAFEALPTDCRFRISSIEPNLLTNEMIDFVASSHRFVPHFHIPLQAGSNTILKAMRRRYLRDVHEKKVRAIREKMPHAGIGCDVIVGFPGETEALFQETVDYLTALPITYLHVFSYSERANTHAVSLPDKVSEADKKIRSRVLHELSEKKQQEFLEKNQGSVRQVIFEKEKTDDFLFGYTENYIRVAHPYDPVLINERVPVLLQDFYEKGVLRGEVVETLTHALSH